MSDLNDYPTNGIHHHLMVLANYCKGRGIDQNETMHLLYSKFQQKPQRRELQKNEIENAVAKTYSSPSISIKKIGNNKKEKN